MSELLQALRLPALVSLEHAVKSSSHHLNGNDLKTVL